jgi:hypothetical protein
MKEKGDFSLRHLISQHFGVTALDEKSAPRPYLQAYHLIIACKNKDHFLVNLPIFIVVFNIGREK